MPAEYGLFVRGQIAETCTDQEDERHQRLGQRGHQLIHQGEQGAHDARDVRTRAISLIVRAVGHHGDRHIGGGVVRAVTDAEEHNKQDGMLMYLTSWEESLVPGFGKT